MMRNKREERGKKRNQEKRRKESSGIFQGMGKNILKGSIHKN